VRRIKFAVFLNAIGGLVWAVYSSLCKFPNGCYILSDYLIPLKMGTGQCSCGVCLFCAESQQVRPLSATFTRSSSLTLPWVFSFGYIYFHLFMFRRLIMTYHLFCRLVFCASHCNTSREAQRHTTGHGASLRVWGIIGMVLTYMFFLETSHPHPGRTREMTSGFNFV